MSEPCRIFVGYDAREAAAFHVCVNSIIRHAVKPVAIIPLALNTFASRYAEHHGDGSNEFIYSRFLVPYLCGFRGRALFIDGDMLIRDDITELFEMARPFTGVSVVKRPDYETKHRTKYLDAPNENYPRKNWSSVILWECSFWPNRVLTPDYVARANGAHLHRFEWLEDHQIGELPADWNWLVGEQEPNEAARLLHFTIGLPAFPGYEKQDGAEEWWREFQLTTEPVRSYGA